MNIANKQYLTTREWIKERIYWTEHEIDKLYQYYPNDISATLMNILENIIDSEYHSTMRILITMPNNIKFDECRDKFFVEYYNLICKLVKIAEEDYS